MEVKSKDLIDIFDLEIRKNCRNKKKVYQFEKNKMGFISNITILLNNNNYYPGKYNIFIIRDPKFRIVMSLSIFDKIVNHYITRHILIPKLDKYLDIRCIATRKGYGVDYGIKLTKKYLEVFKKYDEFYILKLDIKKYFYNIDHSVLKSLLVDKLNHDEYELISRIIDSTNFSYINEEIDRNIKLMVNKHPKDKDKIMDLPKYEVGKGLGLGAMTSQFLSIFYLYLLDHFIVHTLKLKYMIHYMDDIIILYNDKNYLESCLIKIKDMIENKFKLKVNDKKTNIVSSKNGFTFLGYRFIIENNRTIMKIRSETVKKIRKRIKTIKYLYNNNYISSEKMFCALNNYLYSFKYANNIKISKCIFGETNKKLDRYGFFKKIYSDYVILLKRKDSYITYDIDRKILNVLGVNDLIKHNINYLILDGLDIVDIKNFNNNNYCLYKDIICVYFLINKMKKLILK